MAEQTEVKSDNARNVIFSYRGTVYFVNRVKVQFREGVERFKAVFHARRVNDSQSQFLEVEINQATYDMLMEYARLDKPDLILFLQIEGDKSKWCLMSENWLKKETTETGNTWYVV